MTKTNSFTKIILVVMSVMMLISAISIFASATNVDDPFSFTFNGYMDRTNVRYKDNESNMYMYCVSSDTPYIASARGRATQNYGDFVDCSYDIADPTPKVFTYTFTPGIKRFMYNYVRENGFVWAAISANTSSNGYATGWWSPDSVYESGVRPPSEYN